LLEVVDSRILLLEGSKGFQRLFLDFEIDSYYAWSG
jgi:hypothetical protein